MRCLSISLTCLSFILSFLYPFSSFATSDRKQPDGWAYKLSVCGTVKQEELPAECVGVNSWGAQVVQFAAANESRVVHRTGCGPVGTVVTEATRVAHGVQLVWQDNQHGADGEATTVTGSFECDEDGVGTLGPMAETDSRGEVKEFGFTWKTSAACHDWPVPPVPPAHPDVCDTGAGTAEGGLCTCDGTDISNLAGTYSVPDADKTSHCNSSAQSAVACDG